MAIDPETIGIGAAGGTGGIIAAIIHFFNREKLIDLKKDLEDHKSKAITTAICSPCQALATAHRTELKEDITEIKADVKDMQKNISQLQTDVRTVIDIALNRQRPVL